MYDEDSLYDMRCIRRYEQLKRMSENDLLEDEDYDELEELERYYGL